MLRDYCDGDAYHNHCLFSSHPNGLQVLLYYDDVEFTNPLGSHKNKHKQGYVIDCVHQSMYMYIFTPACMHTCTVLNTGIFYFMLGNLHPRHRSKYCSIHLAAICNKKLISKYSMNAVLAPIVEELKKLVSFCLGHIHVNKYFSSPPASNIYVICSH